MKKLRIVAMRKVLINTLLFAMSFGAGMFLAKAAKAQDTKSLLWKIEGNELAKPSYLYGTIHAICPEDFFLKESVKEALKNTDQIVLELDMDDPQFMMKMQQNMMNPGMSNISDQFSEEDRKLVNDFLIANFGANLDQLGIVKPFGLAAMVIQKTISCDKPESYEQVFIKNAAEREIELIGLETIEFQATLFDDEPMEDQIKMVVDGVKEFEDGKDEFKQLVEVYKTEDIVELQQLLADSPQFASFADLLVFDRNKNWIPKITQITRETPSFIAVGALHLAGENGVINLLKKEGYKVTAIINQSE